ncbi:hypothetical protein [uncultured Nostoc sp.]|uniref:hypothetical protein n=1 Tax=uncultured Nostoc sp. TaxID=340711 RepID=UPI0035CC681C
MSYKGHKRDWYIFPEDRVVAIWNKSANGAKSWLEVAAQYPEAVWLAATKHRDFSAYPLTTLKECQTTYVLIGEFEQLPIIAEALEKGWSYEWTYLKYAKQNLIKEATEHLKGLAESISKEELVSRMSASQDNPVSPPNLPLDAVSALEPASQVSTVEPDSQVVADTLTKTELLGRFKTNPNTSSNRLKTIELNIESVGGILLKPKKILEWSSTYDPEGLAWLPVDDSRELWRQASPVLAPIG